jgi:hypothetical protein
MYRHGQGALVMVAVIIVAELVKTMVLQYKKYSI